MSDVPIEEPQVYFGIEDPKHKNFRWNIKRRKFVYYFVRNGGHIGKALESAGYAAHSASGGRGDNWWRHAAVQRAINQELRACLQKEGENSETIIARWANLAQANIADYFKMDQDGVLNLIDLDSLSEDQQKRIKKVTATVNQYGQNVSLELHDVMKANDRLAEIHGVIRNESSSMSPEEAGEAIRRALTQMDKIDSVDADDDPVTH